MKSISAVMACPIVLGAALLAGCGSDTDPATAPESAGSPAVSSSAQAGSAADAPAQKVDPNTASMGELTAAFEAAGVPNAEKWAREVKEYGPYTSQSIQPTLTEELGKYGIDKATLTTILSVLDPR